MTELETPTKPEKTYKTEEFHVSGDELLARVKEIVHEGNVRRIILKNEEGHTILEFPLTVGVVTALIFPVWVAIGAIAAMAARYTIVVERAE